MPTIVKSVTLVPGESFTLPPNSTVLTTSGNVDSTCDLPTPETLTCYGIHVIISDTESGSSAPAFDRICFNGLYAGGSLIPFTECTEITAGNTDLAILGTQIAGNDTAKAFILNFKSESIVSSDQGRGYIAVFQSLPSLMQGAYFSGSMYGRVDTVGEMAAYIPILTLAQIQTITGITNFTC